MSDGRATSNRVWVVTSGSYSDYHIVRVFGSKAAATEYVAQRSQDRWSEFNAPEEWDVVDDPPRRVQAWYGRVVVSADGGQIVSLVAGRIHPEVWCVGLKDEDEVPARPKVSVRQANSPLAVSRVGAGGTEVAVEARTEEAAMKAMMDRAYRVAADRVKIS